MLIDLTVEDGVALLSLNNPPLNLFTRQLTTELGAALAEIEADPEIRSVVVTGAGTRAFSAGSDIREFPALMERGTVIPEKLATENEVFDRLARLPQPTIAAIEGVALGGGAEFALCCDLRIIAAGARIGFPEITLGTVPGSGGLSRLPRLVGRAAALGLCLDGMPIDAHRALAIGLVDEVVDGGTCVAAALARARLWASRAASAIRVIKRAIDREREEVTREMTEFLEVSRDIFATDDMREGVAAFVEKRAPRFNQK
jgi:enoyl-CoA hydratase